MKKTLGLLALLGGMSIGEYVQPYSSIKESIQFHQVPVGGGFAADPWNYELKRELIEEDGKTYQGIYLVNEQAGIHKKINEDGCTCDMGRSIDDFFSGVKEWGGEQYQKGKTWISNNYDKLISKEK